MKCRSLTLTALLLAPLGALHAADVPANKPNVLLIVCDDLNGYIEGFGGHPQTKTPNLTRLRESGVSFQQAHCTSPICAPSRASFLTGLYPHTSRNPSEQSYTLRSKDWRYIRYSNGKEELYDHVNDPHEWTNLAAGSVDGRNPWTSRGAVARETPFIL